MVRDEGVKATVNRNINLAETTQSKNYWSPLMHLVEECNNVNEVEVVEGKGQLDSSYRKDRKTNVSQRPIKQPNDADVEQEDVQDDLQLRRPSSSIARMKPYIKSLWLR